MDWLKEFDLKRWWNAAIVVGLSIALGALASKDRDAILIGLGIVACGFGEWMNHRKEMEINPRGTLTTYPRFNRPQGLALDALGIMLVGIGLYRFVIS